MLRFLLFFRYGMAFRGHPYAGHVAVEEAAFGRRLTAPVSFKGIPVRPA